MESRSNRLSSNLTGQEYGSTGDAIHLPTGVKRTAHLLEFGLPSWWLNRNTIDLLLDRSPYALVFRPNARDVALAVCPEQLEWMYVRATRCR